MSLLTFYKVSSIIILMIDNGASATVLEQLEALYMSLNQPELWSWPKSIHPCSKKRMWQMTVVFTRVDGILWLKVTIDRKYTVYDGYSACDFDQSEWNKHGFVVCSFCQKLPTVINDEYRYKVRAARVVINIHMGKFVTNLRIETAECCELVKRLIESGIGFRKRKSQHQSLIITKYLSAKMNKRAKVRVNGTLYYSGPQLYHQINKQESTLGLCRCFCERL